MKINAGGSEDSREEGGDYADCPAEHVDGEDDLAGPAADPVRAGDLVVEDGLLGDVLEGLHHELFDLLEPDLDVALALALVHVDLAQELDDLLLGGDHAGDDGAALELELVDRLEALADVLLHLERVLRVGEDLEQLLVGQEVEARERLPLRLEVLGELLLDLLQVLVVLLEVDLEPLRVDALPQVLLSGCASAGG